MDLIAVASKTPMPVLRLGIQVASFWLSMFPNKGVTTWRRNVAPLLGREPSRAETRRAVDSWGRNLSQSLHLDRWSPDRINAAVTISDADLERVESYCQKGAVFVLPHMGNWDLAGAWINQRGFPVTSVAENLPDAQFARFQELRSAIGIEIFGHREPRVLDRLLESARSGRIVCLVGDRNLGRRGTQVTWPTEPPMTTGLPEGAQRLARNLGVPLVGVACSYESCIMRIRISHALWQPGCEAGFEAIQQRVCDFFAESIARDAVDWHVMQPFWPSRS